VTTRRRARVLRGTDARGFTLLELLVALAIVGVLLAIAFGGMRVALAAWRQGEDRAEAHQHVRGVAFTLARALGGIHPYRASRGLAPEPVLLFDGQPTRLEFVTHTPPVSHPTPIAFTAVVIGFDDRERRGLTIRQRALPNQDPFDRAQVVLSDSRVTALEFAYLDDHGVWQRAWDGAGLRATPRAIKIRVAIEDNGRRETLPALTVPLRTPAQ
jgi:general secretion pathway protein J